jgi:hypothetical protein
VQQRGVDARIGRHARAGGAVLSRATAAKFDRETLALIDSTREVDIETIRRDGTTKRTRIWAVVVDDDVFVRSWLGERGHWYRQARRAPDDVALSVGGRAIPVRAVHAPDETSLARCSAGLEKKYGRSRSLPFMLVPEILDMTLRLEPR